MPIYKTTSYVYSPIFGNAKQNLIIIPIGKDNKLNSSKSTMQSSEHPFLKKIYMQKYLNHKFMLDGEVGKHIVCANILHLPKPTVEDHKVPSSLITFIRWYVASMKILNGIEGVLPDPTICYCCLCPIKHPISLIRNWILQKKIKMKTTWFLKNRKFN